MQSAGVSVVADGQPGSADRIACALDADTGLGVLRCAEAGDGTGLPLSGNTTCTGRCEEPTMRQLTAETAQHAVLGGGVLACGGGGGRTTASSWARRRRR